MRTLVLIAALAVAALSVGCGPRARPPAAGVDAPAEIQYRPAPPPPGPPAQLLDAIGPGTTWDAGLLAAAEALLSTATGRRARLDTDTAARATARAGFPGQARFSTLLNGGAFPADLVEPVAREALDGPVDVALARRTWGDGTTLWVVAWAPHVVDLNPVPRDLALDDALPVTVYGAPGEELRLFVASPDAPVEEVPLTDGVTRWIDRFHTPGAYRLEVVAKGDGPARVALLFSVFVDAAPEPLPVGVAPLPAAPDPRQAEAALYAAVDALRRGHGLPPVERFPLFESLAREHSALMAASGQVAHVLPDVTPGVPTRAVEIAHPRAQHYENVAAAATAAEALARVVDSPGHLRNLLCESCTHITIGAALEPVLDRPPRVFVTFELLSFPQGPPRPIDHYNR